MYFRILHFLKNFPFGVLVGVMLTLGLCWAFDSDISDDATKLYSFIFSALIGLLAASVALAGVLSNLEKQTEFSERKQYAARAVMPGVLSELYRKSERGFETALGVIALRERDVDIRMAELTQLHLSNDEVDQIKECIEAADPETQSWLSLILAHWQLETSRLESVLFDASMITTNQQSAHRAVDWLVIRAMIIHLFDYARSGSHPKEILDEELIAVPLLSGHFHDQILAEARTKTITYLSKNGGFSADGFKNRLVFRH